MIGKTYPITERLILDALQLAQQLHQELNRETEALKENLQAELISNIAANKKQLVMQLEEFSTRLTQILATEKLPNNQQSVEEYFNRAKTAGLTTDESAGNWTKLMVVCSECRAMNEQNGTIIDLLSRHTKRALDILKGKTESTTTYGANGSIQSSEYSHHLISV
jgi:flagella synthesis protein FlgN